MIGAVGVVHENDNSLSHTHTSKTYCASRTNTHRQSIQPVCTEQDDTACLSEMGVSGRLVGNVCSTDCCSTTILSYGIRLGHIRASTMCSLLESTQ
jgi:hypothetical protein